MIYALKEPYNYREYSIRFSVFQVLSFDEFNSFASYLRFPFAVSDSVRLVARDFTIAALKYTLDAKTPPIEPEVDLLHGIPPEMPFKDKAKILVSATFLRLDALGFAEEIYAWGNKVRDAYPPKNVHALSAWCNLLKSWLIVNLKENNVDAAKLDTDAVQRLMMQDYVDNVRVPEVQLDLPDPARTALLAIILELVDEIATLEKTMESLRANSTNLWTRYIFEPSLVEIEGRFRLQLEAWLKIKSLLSSGEMSALEHWGFQQVMHPSRHFLVTLPAF